MSPGVRFPGKLSKKIQKNNSPEEGILLGVVLENLKIEKSSKNRDFSKSFEENEKISKIESSKNEIQKSETSSPAHCRADYRLSESMESMKP